MFSDADPFNFEIALLFGNGNQAEIGGAAADVADEDDIPATYLVTPIAADLCRPCIKSRLRLLK